MRVLVVLSAFVLVHLQYRLWFGDVGYFSVSALRSQVVEQAAVNERLRVRNRLLAFEVAAYQSKTDFSIVEARARSELGMIKEDETFYLVTGLSD